VSAAFHVYQGTLVRVSQYPATYTFPFCYSIRRLARVLFL